MSAVNPIRVAVVAALKTSSVGAKVYPEGETDRDTPLPYLVIGPATEGKGGFYMAPGYEGTLQVKCWAEDSWGAQALYEEVEGKLDGVALTVSGHTLMECEVTRLDDFAEPNPEVGGHVVIARVRTSTLAAA